MWSRAKIRNIFGLERAIQVHVQHGLGDEVRPVHNKIRTASNTSLHGKPHLDQSDACQSDAYVKLLIASDSIN